MNPFTVNLFRVNPFTVNLFRVNPFTVNLFTVSLFRVDPFTVNPPVHGRGGAPSPERLWRVGDFRPPGKCLNGMRKAPRGSRNPVRDAQNALRNLVSGFWSPVDSVPQPVRDAQNALGVHVTSSGGQRLRILRVFFKLSVLCIWRFLVEAITEKDCSRRIMHSAFAFFAFAFAFLHRAGPAVVVTELGAIPARKGEPGTVVREPSASIWYADILLEPLFVT